VEYNIADCIHCGDEVFIDEETENIDNLPQGINVVIGGGDHISVEKTSPSSRVKDYRVPKVVVKWFSRNTTISIDNHYLCPPCAESLYGFDRE